MFCKLYVPLLLIGRTRQSFARRESQKLFQQEKRNRQARAVGFSWGVGKGGWGGEGGVGEGEVGEGEVGWGGEVGGGGKGLGTCLA